jgi:Dihydrodipicolinate synthase/N-acetylneuraminate lyase
MGPVRTVVNIPFDTIGKPLELPWDAAGKRRDREISPGVALQRLASPEDFVQLSGEDVTAVGFNAMGGTGCISVSANVAPDLCARMQEATLNGDYPTAVALQDKLTPLHDAMFSDTNPAPVKYALSLLGLCSAEVRLPLTECEESAQARVKAALEGLGLL